MVALRGLGLMILGKHSSSFVNVLIESVVAGMIAGGTGITPMYQVASALLGDPNEYTSISLIYANLTEDDILIKKELDELSNYYAR